MSMEKQAAEAVHMLVSVGVDANDAAQMVMEKIASFDEVARGLVSPAWMESHIARKHGKNSPDGFGENYAIHTGANARASLRGLGQGLVGGAAGFVAGGGVRGRGIPGAAIGMGAGMIHGIGASLSNQAKEMHNKYREKSAAVGMLIEDGLDFDSAVSLVQAKSSELYGE